ncbi:hypothetical protein EDB83DRAFT_1409780 [Lactarius deliciosus]|nr:hypothetical protein EDB83DRAFT_1409780 [Lactarius deliciosus]
MQQLWRRLLVISAMLFSVGMQSCKDGVHVKGLVLEDLIQNVEILFDEQPSPHSLIPSSGVAEARSTYAYDSSNSSPEFAQPAEGRAMGSSTSGLVGTETVERFLNSTPPEGVPVLSTNVSEWLARLPPHSEAPTIPQSPLESVLSNTSNFPLSSATSLQTAT